MKEKKILIIDDGVSGLKNALERLGKNMAKYSLSPNLTFIDLSKSKYKTQIEGSDEVLLDKSKIKKDLIDNHFGINYDVVACDFNFANDDYNGFELLTWLVNTSRQDKHRIRHSIFIFYSHEDDKVIDYLNNNNKVKSLINLNIDSFEKKDNLNKLIPNLLRNKEEKIDYQGLVRSKLDDYPEEILKSGVYMKYTGKTFGYIANEIEKEQHHGVRFVKSMVERTIAHIITLNED